MSRFNKTPSFLTRRRWMQSIGGAFSLPWIAERLAVAGDANRSQRPRSIICIWLRGGPSQYETFDPHPGTKYGGHVKAIPSSVPGLEVSEFLPRSAAQLHRTALIRSVLSKEGDHRRAIYNLQTGWRPDPTVIHPSLGALVCYQTQSMQGAEIPRHISLLPESFAGRGGYLGGRFDAFKVNDPAKPIADLNARVESDRYERRLKGLKDIIEDSFLRGRLKDLQRQRTMHSTVTETAKVMMSSKQLEAFDLHRESLQTVTPFGDSAFGRSCLASVRLIEVGVRSVEIGLSGWDTHVDNHQGQKTQCDILDPAFASLLELLAQRELLDSTLVVCGGEFGRSPTVNPLGGRDHWPHGFSIVLAGCGIRPGVVHGATSPEPTLDKENLISNVTDPVSVEDVHATILQSLGISYEEEIVTPIGRPLKWSEGTPIESVLKT